MLTGYQLSGVGAPVMVTTLAKGMVVKTGLAVVGALRRFKPSWLITVARAGPLADCAIAAVVAAIGRLQSASATAISAGSGLRSVTS